MCWWHEGLLRAWFIEKLYAFPNRLLSPLFRVGCFLSPSYQRSANMLLLTVGGIRDDNLVLKKWGKGDLAFCEFSNVPEYPVFNGKLISGPPPIARGVNGIGGIIHDVKSAIAVYIIIGKGGECSRLQIDRIWRQVFIRDVAGKGILGDGGSPFPIFDTQCCAIVDSGIIEEDACAQVED